MLEMVADNQLLGREDRQVIANKVVDISVIQLAIIKDFRLVLLVSSTIECPKLIFGKLNLFVLDNDLSTVNTKRESTEELFFRLILLFVNE